MSSLVSTVLLEFGSVFLRGGLAGESGPRFIVSAPRENSSRLSLFEFLSAIFNKYLPVKTKECRVLIIEKIFSHTRFRNDLLTVLLKDMQVLEVSIQPDLVLPSLTICNTPESTIPSAVVVDIGETQSRSIAIAYGRPLLDTLKVSSIGVKQAAARFRVMIEKHLDAEVDEKAARQLFEMVAKAFSTTTTSTSLKLTMPQDIEVPSCKGISNSSIIIPSDMRFKCLSSLLTGSDTDEDDPSQQEILIDEAGGASGILLETLKCCNHDVRGLVSLNIIICGGGSTIPDMAEAICMEATKAALTHEKLATTLKPVVETSPGGELVPRVTPFIPSSLAWIGASLFASIRSNDPKFVKLESFRHASSQSSATEGIVPTLTSKAVIDYSETLICPDWMSCDASAWQFVSFQKGI